MLLCCENWMKSALKATLFMTRGAPFRERNTVLEVIMLKIPKSDKFGLFGKILNSYHHGRCGSGSYLAPSRNGCYAPNARLAVVTCKFSKIVNSNSYLMRLLSRQAFYPNFQHNEGILSQYGCRLEFKCNCQIAKKSICLRVRDTRLPLIQK